MKCLPPMPSFLKDPLPKLPNVCFCLNNPRYVARILWIVESVICSILLIVFTILSLLVLSTGKQWLGLNNTEVFKIFAEFYACIVYFGSRLYHAIKFYKKTDDKNDVTQRSDKKLSAQPLTGQQNNEVEQSKQKDVAKKWLKNSAVEVITLTGTVVFGIIFQLKVYLVILAAALSIIYKIVQCMVVIAFFHHSTDSCFKQDSVVPLNTIKINEAVKSLEHSTEENPLIKVEVCKCLIKDHVRKSV